MYTDEFWITLKDELTCSSWNLIWTGGSSKSEIGGLIDKDKTGPFIISVSELGFSLDFQ